MDKNEAHALVLDAISDAQSAVRIIDEGKYSERDGTLLLTEDQWGTIRDVCQGLAAAKEAVSSLFGEEKASAGV